ncbi:serine hydrolase domain-containing protein [Rhodococcus sp. NPDC058481]|uniref:serine hydrolase domain-containing protein n=1 Tax=unclassified Rhodococcus (in: high G+C Gram-positive bacteria) TaxID=192944 RepID=UPI00364947B0
MRLIPAVVAAALLTSFGGSASAATGGDTPTRLEQLAREILAPSPGRSVDVAYVDSSGITRAHLGEGDAGEYEIGSITKTFTAQLFSVAIDRAEVRADTRLGELLPVQGTAVADVTLEALAGHRSGLLEFAATPDMVAGGVEWKVNGRNPFTFNREELLAHARVAPLIGRGSFRYSTLGYALLGQALAAAAHTDYPTLANARIVEPLGLDDTWIPGTNADLPADVSTGVDESGRPQEPWAIDAYAPAGGARSTLADMAAYAQALIRGDAPGSAALQPRWSDAPTLRRGYGWGIAAIDGVDYTMHAGGTGGFSGNIVLDRTNGVALVVLQDTAANRERSAVDLLRRMREG